MASAKCSHEKQSTMSYPSKLETFATAVLMFWKEAQSQIHGGGWNFVCCFLDCIQKCLMLPKLCICAEANMALLVIFKAKCLSYSFVEFCSYFMCKCNMTLLSWFLTKNYHSRLLGNVLLCHIFLTSAIATLYTVVFLHQYILLGCYIVYYWFRVHAAAILVCI